MAEAQEQAPGRSFDYGAETVEPPVPLTKALPVEQVEQQGQPVDLAAVGEARPAAAAPTSPGDLEQAGNEPLDAETSTLLNARDIDISTLVKTFSRLTGRNYIIDSAVKGTVTIHLPTAVTLAEALRIFDSVLLLKGFTTVPIGSNTWKVVAAKDAQQTTIPVMEDGVENPSDKIVTQLVRLKYIQASDMQQLLSKFVSKDGGVNSFSGTNSLIIIDSQANIERLKRIISELDVPALDQDITIIPISYANAKDVAEKVMEILGQEEEEQAPAQTPRLSAARRRAQAAAAARAAQRDGNVEGSRTLPLKVIPDERTNSLIVVADEDSTAKVRALVEQLDSQVDLSGGRFFVYRLKHADAEALAEILGKLISGSEGSTTPGGTTGSSLTRSSRASASDATASVSQRVAAALQRRRALATGGQTNAAGGDRVNLEGEVSIAPDPATNSLVINASRGDYLRIKELIDELDIKRRQVIVEATILEVSLNKDEGMGIELQGTGATDEAGVFAQNNFGGLTNLVTNPAALSDLTIAAASAGTITLPGGIVLPSQAALLTAVSRNSNVNVLSSPTILTTDNEEAEIIVGENVPFVTSTSTDPTNLNNTFNQVERQDVGITLRITPQISTGDFVTLKIFAEISNVVAGTRNDPNGPTTTIRTTETTVEVRSGQMIVTGGLISDNVTESTRGIPYLQDIPVLGQLFQRDDISQRRTNLLVFLTPKIIRDQHDARETTIERRDELERTMIEQGAEPAREDVLHSRRIDMVTESLPPDGIENTTITPPRPASATTPPPSTEDAKAIERTNERLRSLLNQAPASAGDAPVSGDAPGDDTIDITVKPKLPLASPAPAPAQQHSAAENSPRTYVVLRGSHPSKSDGGAADTVGLRLLGDLSSSSSRFFEVGARYKLAAGGGEREYICLGKFSSAEEAATMHPNLRADSWQSLSPQETLALGNGPWRKG